MTRKEKRVWKQSIYQVRIHQKFQNTLTIWKKASVDTKPITNTMKNIKKQKKKKVKTRLPIPL